MFPSVCYCVVKPTNYRPGGGQRYVGIRGGGVKPLVVTTDGIGYRITAGSHHRPWIDIIGIGMHLTISCTWGYLTVKL